MIHLDYDAKTLFARNLKRLMDEHDKKQIDLVTDLGLKSSTLSEWINCKKYPRTDKLDMLAKYFGVEVAEFGSKDKLNNSYSRSTDINKRITDLVDELTFRQATFKFKKEPLTEREIQLIQKVLLHNLQLIESLLELSSSDTKD